MNTIKWTPTATKQWHKLPEKVKVAIHSAVQTLEGWPTVSNVKKLVNREEYRLRVGRYRVLFSIDISGKITVILINEVKKRDERTYQ